MPVDKKPKEMAGAEKVLRQAVGQLLSSLNLQPDTTGLVSSLSAKKTKADPDSALYQVGESIASHFGLKWLPHIFTKEIHKPVKAIIGVQSKVETVKEKYTCIEIEGIDNLIILDDIVTTGATMGEMVRALKDGNQNGCITPIGLAILKTIDKKNPNANSTIPPEWDELWNS